MKTITYNEQTHRLVPVEPTEEMLMHFAGLPIEQLHPSKQAAEFVAYKAMLSAAPQPEPVEVEPVGYVISGGKFNGRLLQPYEYELNVHPELERWKVCCRPLYTAPPDYEVIKRQRDELVKALEECRFALEPYDDIKPRDWKTDRERLVRAHQSAIAPLASMKGGAA